MVFNIRGILTAILALIKSVLDFLFETLPGIETLESGMGLPTSVVLVRRASSAGVVLRYVRGEALPAIKS